MQRVYEENEWGKVSKIIITMTIQQPHSPHHHHHIDTTYTTWMFTAIDRSPLVPTQTAVTTSLSVHHIQKKKNKSYKAYMMSLHNSLLLPCIHGFPAIIFLNRI